MNQPLVFGLKVFQRWQGHGPIRKLTKTYYHDSWPCFSRFFIHGAIVAIVVSIPTLSRVVSYLCYSLDNWYNHYPTPVYYSYLQPTWPLFWWSFQACLHPKNPLHFLLAPCWRDNWPESLTSSPFAFSCSQGEPVLGGSSWLVSG